MENNAFSNDQDIINLNQLAEAEMRAGRFNEAIIFYNNILSY